ncbi:DUF2975 domain-containing protein [Nonomuraea sp. FMUSA5-5]|uniref:DUF2975 domain-containing protein n=1 Tax=Nonomuraea composti TaxID=2720023 RepID=A0ABX1BLN1_9ACTN|nr:DUF2975 domain-containing protein [Nonomuraea sp. FMUSA5-5]
MSRAYPLTRTLIVVRVLLALYVVVLAYEIGHAILTGGENAYSGQSAFSLVCVDAPAATQVEGNVLENPPPVKKPREEKPEPAEDSFFPVEPGVEFFHPLPQMCKDDSSPGIQALYQSSRLTTALVVLAAIVQLERLITRARRESGFDEAVVRGLRVTGLILGVGTLVSSLYETLAEIVLTDWMVPGRLRAPWDSVIIGWDVPWAFLIAGIGLTVLSKVVRVGARMREELEGTV